MLKRTILKLLITPLICCVSINAQEVVTSVDKFTGTAKRAGQVIYTEKNQASFDVRNKIISAYTEYFDPSGSLIASLKSDFTKNLTAPEHEFKDYRFKHRHGIRNIGQGRLVMFKQDEGETEKTKIINLAESNDKLVIGCQGLAYYFQEHIDNLLSTNNTKLLLLTPGNLDSANFILSSQPSDDLNLVQMNLKIKSILLRIFVPHLELTYDKKSKHIRYYKGLSNLWNDKRKPQSVEISYEFDL